MAGEWWSPGDFNLGGGSSPGPFDFGSEPTFDLGNFHLDMPNWNTYDFGNVNLPSGGGNWNFSGWGDAMKNIIGPGFQIGKDTFQTILGYKQQQANADYQRRLDAYNKQRADAEAKYNQQVGDYLQKRSQWEQEMLGFGQEQAAGFQGAFGEFKGQMQEAMENAQGVLSQYLNAALPLFKQSQQLLEPAIAALAKGEVPESLQPVLNQAKQRALAAAVNQLVTAGRSPEEAMAIAGPQVDQMAQTMLVQAAQAMFGSGIQAGAQGLQGLQGALGAVNAEGNIATAMMDPIMREFLAMEQLLGNMFSGFPGLAPSQGQPAAPTA